MKKQIIIFLALTSFLPMLGKAKKAQPQETEFKAGAVHNPEHGCGQPEAPVIIKAEQTGTASLVEEQPEQTVKKPGKFKKKKKKKKKEKKAAEPRKTLSKMSFDELVEMGDKQVAADQKEAAVKFYEKALPRCTDMTALKKLTLTLADLQFELGHLDKAGKLYNEFGNLYPGDSKAEYVDYKAILSHFYLTLDADRDQSFTQKTLTLAEKFLDRTIYQEYAPDVSSIRDKCCEKLVEHEIHVFNHYLTRGSFTSAHNRLNYIKKEFLAKIPGVEPRLLTLEVKLALRQNNLTLAQQKKEDLTQRFPAYYDKKHRSWLTEFELAMGEKKKAKNRF
jgi:outer membrane assembly lipoprotein YfiO